jgi:hypothetical protein
MVVAWDCAPVTRRVRIGWLAITPKNHPFRVAVTADTEEEAERRFSAEMAAWKALHERAVEHASA